MASKGFLTKALFLALVFIIPFTSYLYLKSKDPAGLNIYGPREFDPAAGDTVYHSIPPFSFVNQDGKAVTDRDMLGFIYVADFFFTHCQGICPKMTNQLTRVQEIFKNNKEVKILSHTVDPKRDSVQRLKEYAVQWGAQPGKWDFVTGSKKELYMLARKGYFISATDGDGSEEDFVHSEKFVLIDKKGHIRGFYDGTVREEVDLLIDDIYTLFISKPK